MEMAECVTRSILCKVGDSMILLLSAVRRDKKPGEIQRTFMVT